MRIAMIGCGVMGGGHVRVLKEVAKCEVVALCDLVPEKMREVIRLGHVPADTPCFTDYRKLLEWGGFDLAAVAVPHPLHLEISLAVLRGGFHLMCEKPVTVTAGEADLLLAEAAKHRVLFSTMYALRPLPIPMTIRKLLDSGVIGRIFRVDMVCTKWARSDAYYHSSDWRGTWVGEGGGLLMNQAPHNLDALYHWFGDALWVRAELSHRAHKIETEDEVSAEIMTRAGFPIRFYATTGELPGTDRLEIVGDAGSIIREGDRLVLRKMNAPASRLLAECPSASPVPEIEEITPELPPAGAGGHAAIWRELGACFESGDFTGNRLAPGVEGIHAVEWANAMVLSHFTGRLVELPVDRAAYDALLGELRSGARKL